MNADRNGTLQPGELGIDSMLPLPPPLEFGGPATTRIVKSVLNETGRSSTTIEITPPAAGGAHSHELDLRERATLTYDDEQGHHEFSMCKDTLSIGRGGSSVWVDVQVFTTSKVSREHCRLRRDRSGRFFIQDASSWGTSVDGVAIPPAVKGADGVLRPGGEHEIVSPARIRARRRARHRLSRPRHGDDHAVLAALRVPGGACGRSRRACSGSRGCMTVADLRTVTAAVLSAAARTHPGRVRLNNEDLPVLDAARGVFGVIDGIGGQAGGEVAAATARDVILANRRLPCSSTTTYCCSRSSARGGPRSRRRGCPSSPSPRCGRSAWSSPSCSRRTSRARASRAWPRADSPPFPRLSS